MIRCLLSTTVTVESVQSDHLALGPELLAALDRWSYYADSTEKIVHLGPQEVATIGRWLPYTGGH